MFIKENLFDLTPEQIDMSKMIYNGKIIKCLVAPYHSYNQLEKEVTYTKNTFLFPEREMPSYQCLNLISLLVNNPAYDEYLIITANQNIILDMIDGNVRILTEKDEIVDCPVKTFLANIHDIRYKVLENKDHQLSEKERSESAKLVQNLVELVQSGSEMTKVEYDNVCAKIEMVGEKFIRTKLFDMANSNIKITDYNENAKIDAKIEQIEKEIERLIKLKNDNN